MQTLSAEPVEIPTRAPSARTVSKALPTLDELAVRYGTDKRIGVHSYTRWYDAMFSPRRFQPLLVLEMGVQSGASIKMWADYFPQARLIGIDIDPRCAQFATDRIQIITGGQENPDVAAWIAQTYPDGLDIVIDDGSHVSEHQRASLDLYFPMVKAGGLYIVEDLHCSYSPKFRGNTDRTIMEILKGLADDVNLNGNHGLGDYDASEQAVAATRPLSIFEREIESITFLRSMAVIQKRVR